MYVCRYYTHARADGQAAKSDVGWSTVGALIGILLPPKATRRPQLRCRKERHGFKVEISSSTLSTGFHQVLKKAGRRKNLRAKSAQSDTQPKISATNMLDHRPANPLNECSNTIFEHQQKQETCGQLLLVCIRFAQPRVKPPFQGLKSSKSGDPQKSSPWKISAEKILVEHLAVWFAGGRLMVGYIDPRKPWEEPATGWLRHSQPRPTNSIFMLW